MSPLSRIWKGLVDTRNKSFEAMEVPIDTFAKLIEQTTVLPSIIINLVYKSLKHFENIVERSP